MADEQPTRPTRKSIEAARQGANDITAARRTERLKATHGVSYEEARWRELSPEAQDAFNKLRIARGQAPLSPVKPKSDPYIAPPEQLRPFDPADPEAIAAAHESSDVVFGDDATDEEKVAARDTAESWVAAYDGDPAKLAERIERGFATSEERKLNTDLLLGRRKRAAHRPDTEDKKIRRRAAKSILRAWGHLERGKRKKLKTVLGEIKDDYRIERSEAFVILREIRVEEDLTSKILKEIKADERLVAADDSSEGFQIRKQDEES